MHRISRRVFCSKWFCGGFLVPPHSKAFVNFPPPLQTQYFQCQDEFLEDLPLATSKPRLGRC